MNDYLIGSGAVLTAGPSAGITSATLHAQTDPALAARVQAAVVDFESSSVNELSKIVVVISGWTAGRVAQELVTPLLERTSCTLAEVMELVASSCGAPELHLFARWLPDEMLSAALRRTGVTLVAHPLESILRAALISGQSYSRWAAPLHAA